MAIVSKENNFSKCLNSKFLILATKLLKERSPSFVMLATKHLKKSSPLIVMLATKLIKERSPLIVMLATKLLKKGCAIFESNVPVTRSFKNSFDNATF